jgi:hypothetical protein
MADYAKALAFVVGAAAFPPFMDEWPGEVWARSTPVVAVDPMEDLGHGGRGEQPPCEEDWCSVGRMRRR